jgi:hypothetical protein
MAIAAQKAAEIGSYISKPAIAILMIFAMPSAVSLLKVIFPLDYLEYLDVRDKPPII